MKYLCDEDRIEDRKELYLAFIANELAEANRLKRVELEITVIKLADAVQITKFDMKRVTEDKAE